MVVEREEELRKKALVEVHTEEEHMLVVEEVASQLGVQHMVEWDKAVVVVTSLVEEVEALLQEASNTKGHMLDDIAEFVVIVVLADYSKLVNRLGSMFWGNLGDMVAVLLLEVALVALQEVVVVVLGVVQHHHSTCCAHWVGHW